MRFIQYKNQDLCMWRYVVVLVACEQRKYIDLPVVKPNQVFSTAHYNHLCSKSFFSIII